MAQRRKKVTEKREEQASLDSPIAAPNQPELEDQGVLQDEPVEHRHGTVPGEGIPAEYRSAKQVGRPKKVEKTIAEIDEEAEKARLLPARRPDREVRWNTLRRKQLRYGVVLPQEVPEDFE